MPALSDREHQLLEAVRQQDLAAVLHQLAEGADVSATDAQGLTALHLAAAATDGPMVQALLAAGADPSASKFTGGPHRVGTPLLYMAQQQRLGPKPHQCGQQCAAKADVVQQLVAAGAQTWVSATDRSTRGFTSLHYAAAAGCATLVGSLLQGGADASSTTLDMFTVLHAAASSKSVEVVQQVLSALGSKAKAVLRDLGYCYRKNGSGTWGMPLHLAAAAGSAEVVQALVAAGADRDRHDAYGNTPLHSAVAAHQYHLVPLLVTPSNINHATATGTALHMAASHRAAFGTPEQQALRDRVAASGAVSQLLEAGANARARNPAGLTPLAVAAGWGPAEVLQALLQHHLQQQRQQQQHELSRDQVLLVLQQAADHALKLGWGPTWRLLLTTALDMLGEEGMHSLWRTCKQKFQQNAAQEPWCYADSRRRSMLDAWVGAWLSGCQELATQRSCITRRLQQLVISPQQQQEPASDLEDEDVPGQQQEQETGTAAGAQPAAKRRRLRLTASGRSSGTVAETQRAGNSGAESGAEGVDAEHSAPPPLLIEVKAAAAGGSEQQVWAALGQLECRLAGLSAAAVAAAEGGHMGLAIQLLRELALHDAHVAREAVHGLHAATSKQRQQQHKEEEEEEEEEEEQDQQQEEQDEQQQQDPNGYEQQQRKEQQADTQAAVQVADALLADWLEMRRQQGKELRDTVLLAARCAAAAPACG